MEDEVVVIRETKTSQLAAYGYRKGGQMHGSWSTTDQQVVQGTKIVLELRSASPGCSRRHIFWGVIVEDEVGYHESKTFQLPKCIEKEDRLMGAGLQTSSKWSKAPYLCWN